MNSFWYSSLGEITGEADKAFTKSFSHVPDNSYLKAKIKEFEIKDYQGIRYLELTWQIIGTEFDGQLVRQKIRCWEEDENKRYKALQMFKYLHKLFTLEIPNREPEKMDLFRFINKTAGIKVQLTDPNDDGKQYNWISEVHPLTNFETKVGEEKNYEITKKAHAFEPKPIDDFEDLPF